MLLREIEHAKEINSFNLKDNIKYDDVYEANV